MPAARALICTVPLRSSIFFSSLWLRLLFPLLPCQFACVNNILTSKVLPARVGYLIDDFCAYTLTITWLLSNLLFWPLLPIPASLFVGAVEIAFFSLNVLRTWWNWRHEKMGVVDSSKALVAWVKARYFQGKRAGKFIAEQGERGGRFIVSHLPIPGAAALVSSSSSSSSSAPAAATPAQPQPL